MIPLDTLTALHALLASLIAAIDKDAINGTFELAAGFFTLNNCRVLYEHKQARGVSLLSTAFFTLWGCWNLYYYPALDQPLSFYGALFIVAANALYLGMMACYRRTGLRIVIQVDASQSLAEIEKANIALGKVVR